jgi:hypothetical protein
MKAKAKQSPAPRVTSRFHRHGKVVRWNRVIRRKHRKPDMHVQCSSVAAKFHQTRPHVMVAHIRGALSSIREMSGRTVVCRNAGTHRSDDLSSFAHRAGLQDLCDDRDLRHYNSI